MRVAVVQSCTGLDPRENALALGEAIAAAAGDEAEIVFTPEMSGMVDRDRARAAAKVRSEADDPVLSAARDAAARHGVWVQLGSLALSDGRSDGRFVNRGFLIDAGGEIRARYDKMHLFDVALASGESWRESAAYAPGEASVVAETPWGRLGLAICYDLRFPALFQALSAAGARVIAVPAAFTVPTGRAHWEVLLRARAIETASFVVAAAQTGIHEDGRETYGHSLVIDPWGEVLLDMGAKPGVGVVDLDPARADDVRRRVPVLEHRRAIPAATVAA